MDFQVFRQSTVISNLVTETLKADRKQEAAPQVTPQASPAKAGINGDDVQSILTPAPEASPGFQPQVKAGIDGNIVGQLLIPPEPEEVPSPLPPRQTINGDMVAQILVPLPDEIPPDTPVRQQAINGDTVIQLLQPLEELEPVVERPEPREGVNSKAVQELFQAPVDTAAGVAETAVRVGMPQQIQILEPKKSLKSKIRRSGVT